MTRIFGLLFSCAALLAPLTLVFANTSATSNNSATAKPSVTGISLDANHREVKFATALGGQRGEGQPYEVVGTEVWTVPEPKSGRDYQVFVALPPSYEKEPQRRYPVLYVTDADYAFAMLRQMTRRLNLDKPVVEEYILVGLSYAIGESGMPSRRRDYTPTAKGDDGTHGQGQQYLTYLQHSVFPFVAQQYRTDEARRLFLGHSYGALLGAQAMFTAPDMFSGLILGSPSFWFDDHVMWSFEQRYAKSNKDLAAKVYLYVGEYEDTKPGDARYASRYNMVTDAKTFEKALKRRAYPSLTLRLDVLNDEDHLSVAPRGFMHGLKYLLPATKSNKS